MCFFFFLNKGKFYNYLYCMYINFEYVKSIEVIRYIVVFIVRILVKKYILN